MEDENYVSKINLTSLVDVALTLVIIFMVTAPFSIQNGITVDSSKVGAAQGEVAKTENVSVLLNEKGEIRVNSKSVSAEQLPLAIKEALGKSKNQMVILLATPKNSVKQIIDILDCAKQQGAERVALMNGLSPVGAKSRYDKGK